MEVIVTKRPNGCQRVQLMFDQPSKTEQSHRETANINSIIAKAQRTGLFPQRTDRPKYGDFSGSLDFHEARSRIAQAEQDFELLPADLRKRFGNDCGEMLDWLSDPENRAEAVEIGLLPKSAREAAPAAKVAPAKAGEPEPVSEAVSEGGSESEPVAQ